MTIQALNDQQDEFDADLEALGNKKSLSNDEKSRQSRLRVLQERHKWHIRKLELVLRALDNDSVDLSEIAVLRESVEVFIDMHQDPDYVHDEGLYDAFDLANEDDVLEEFLGLERRYAKVRLESLSNLLSNYQPGWSCQDRSQGSGGGSTRSWNVGHARGEGDATCSATRDKQQAVYRATSEKEVVRSGGGV